MVRCYAEAHKSTLPELLFYSEFINGYPLNVYLDTFPFITIVILYMFRLADLGLCNFFSSICVLFIL